MTPLTNSSQAFGHFRALSKALVCIAALACVAANAWASPAATEDAPVATIDDSGGSLSDSTITAHWGISNHHLNTLEITGHSEATVKAATVSLNCPFALELRNLGVLSADHLTIQGVGKVEHLVPNPGASRFSDRLPGIAVHYELINTDSTFTDRFKVEWSLVLREGSHYIRQILTVTAIDKALPLDGITLIDTTAPGIEISGTVKGSPLIDGDFFLGFESPLSQSSVVGNRGVSELHSGVPIAAGQSAQYSAVVGISPGGQMRRSFLHYIERERAHPYRTFLHYNSWFDIGFFTPYSQQDALDRIEAFGQELHQKRGVVLDSYLFDDGWDDHNDLWKIRSDFKDGFEPLQQAAAKYGTAPGVWLSPWGGYGPPKQERVNNAKKEGYEIVDGGLALSGPKYYARFHDAVTEMVTKYGVNQFKFDGTGNADQVVKGSAFSSDFDAAIHLIADLRQLKPDLYINLTTGTYPSPFWLFYADSIWRGGDDTEFSGVGTSRERWITYRDADTYDEIVKAGKLFPLNSLMLHGIVYAQKAPHLSDDPGNDFRNEVHSYFGSGTQLQELYITPSLLKPADWDTLAEAAKWSRTNAATLLDTHWIGGDPRWLNAYGWAAWSPAKGILTLRNPSAKPQTISIDIGEAFELPKGAATRYAAHSPWAEDASQPAVELTAGQPHTFNLAPFQVLTLEAMPR